MTFDDSGVDLSKGEIKPAAPVTPGKDEKPVVLPKLEDVEKGEVVPTPSKEEKTKEVTKPKDDISSILKPPAGKVTDKEKSKDAPTQKVISPKDIKPGARDYTGHTSEEVAALKGMSNEGYSFAKKLLTEKKELEKLKDSSYLQSPDAYRLDPQYRAIQSDAHFAGKEYAYWQEQLALVKSGKPCREVTGYDEKGNFIFGAEVQPTDQVEEQLRMRMNSALQTAQGFQQKAQQFGQTYQQRVVNDLELIESERKSKFAWRQDPELLKHSIEIEGKGDTTLEQIHNDFVSLFPPYQRNQPGVQVAGDLMVALQIQAVQIRQATAGQAIAEEKKEELQRAEPGSIVKPIAQQSVHGVESFDTVGMPAA